MRSLDLVIPVRNEEHAISLLVKRVARALAAAQITYTIIFVDDASTDDTVAKIKALQKKYPIKLLTKKGRLGKAFSIIEGVREATSEYVVMLDADLEYPPEAIPEMLEAARDKNYGVVIARRTTYRSSWLRRIASRVNAWVFGRVLLGLPYDVQSGLKLFHRDISSHIDPKTIRAWAIDLPLLYTAKGLGYQIGEVDIEFAERTHGVSKMHFLTTARDITTSALLLAFSPPPVYHLPPDSAANMIGAGLANRGKRFITHTTLPHRFSAHQRITLWQQFALVSLLGFVMMGLAADWRLTAIVLVAILSTIYFLDVLFNLYLILKSLYFPPEVGFDKSQIEKVKDKELPVYSILCPLYREAHILPQFVSAITQLDWPKDKLDVILLLEEDDKETIKVAGEANLPSCFRTLVVPHSLPKTKPKACNYGLSHARGEYIVVYDAEDQPEPEQLKKAYLGFATLPANVACLQAKLNYHNPHDNLLTRLFTAEYSLWFDVILTGLQTLETSIPLGGTSNHFRTQELKNLHGWDTFNVTEDCDLGARLFLSGKRTAVIDSTTLEEANSNLVNWIRQRSRWIKGYIQTYFVHMRSPIRFLREHGIHALIFQLVVGGKIAFMLINPLLWVATISYFTLYWLVGPTIESLYPTPVFYMAATSMVFGNFLCIYYYMIGCARRGHWSLMKYVYLVPFYWLAASVAAGVALWQFIFKPHYWEKTNHGLHLSQASFREKIKLQLLVQFGWSKHLTNTTVITGGVLVMSTFVANFFNFLYNAYLGRAKNVTVEEFGVISLIGSLLYITQVPTSALAKTVTYRSAFLLGQQQTIAKKFWRYVRSHTLTFSLVITLVWLLLTPYFPRFFHSSSLLPFLIFSPVWIIGSLSAVDRGFLSGSQRFGLLAGVGVFDAVAKLVLAVFLVEIGLPEWVYLSIPLSMLFSQYAGLRAATSLAGSVGVQSEDNFHYFPKRFFATSFLVRLSTIAFLGLDIILAKMYLSPEAAGQYALVALVGKMVYFIGSLFSQFITPVVSRAEGAGTNSRRKFYQLLLVTSLAGFAGFLAVGVFAPFTVPLLFGPKIIPVLQYLPAYTLSILAFTISSSIVNYHQIRRQYVFPALGFILAGTQILGLTLFHHNLSVFIHTMLVLGLFHLVLVTSVHLFYSQLVIILHNFQDFLGLFIRWPINGRSLSVGGQLRILFFNWRDTRHTWAGGAEVYVHELAKRWVKLGHQVTVFAGNDSHDPRHEVLDGVHVIRRGGLYTVYVWAFIYYVIKLRGKYDVVIDSENGIPFFTPLYVFGIPKYLLIHHIHQDLFRTNLYFPMDKIAMLLEGWLMPLVYRHQKIITVSQSSRKDILSLRFFRPENISIVTPGIDSSQLKPGRKTAHPSFIYLGRIRPQKNVDVAIKAFAKVVDKHPRAVLSIAGWGEQINSLKTLSRELGIEKSVKFLGRVSDSDRTKLLAQSWAMIQPSSFEGWGITVIEANACGTPVIGSDVSGLRDSIVHLKTGLLIPTGSVPSLVESINFLISRSQLRNDFSQAAISWSANFDWDINAQKCLEIIIKDTTTTSTYLSVQPLTLPVKIS